MMHRNAGRIVAALSLVFGLYALPAAADGSDLGWYVSGKGGPSYSALTGISSKDGGIVDHNHGSNIIGSFGMAAGYEWMYRYDIPLRTELEFMNRTEVTYDRTPLLQSGPSGALASTAQNVTAMLKLYWHFPVDSDKWWPFVSSGIGWSRNTMKSQYTPTGGSPIGITHSTSDFAYSFGVGATFKLGPRVMNDLELRWVNLGKADWGLPAGSRIQASGVTGFTATEISFSIRYMF